MSSTALPSRRLGWFTDRPILVKVGMEMMRGWYHVGPGRSLVSSGRDFLHFQTGGGGFRSVVKGPAERVGTFELAHFDPRRGCAIVRSTTPFHLDSEDNFFVQVHGDKQFAVFDNTDHSIASEEQIETIISRFKKR